VVFSLGEGSAQSQADQRVRAISSSGVSQKPK
jgi:hypothetical protein